MRSIFVSTFVYLLLVSCPVLADDLLIFGATWCGPCKNLKKVIDEDPGLVAAFNTLFFDIDANPDAAKKYQVRGVPTLIIFQDNGTVRRSTGFKSKTALKKWLQNEN